MGKPYKQKLLGISTSLRNSSWGENRLATVIRHIEKEEDLYHLIGSHPDEWLQSREIVGDDKETAIKSFDGRSGKKKGGRFLSNSEAALASALWAAYNRNKVGIENISLKDHFPAEGTPRNLEHLKDALLSCQALLISGPVYFGDRSSLAQSRLDFIRSDADLQRSLAGKLYSGISVGAKRNGGQETTLIYQMLDYLRYGVFAVGNDSETTSQYGGTCHAGDMGTIHKDSYGIGTSMGVGRRLSNLMVRLNCGNRIKGPLKVTFIILQDRHAEANNLVCELINTRFDAMIDATILDISKMHILRCLACDFCPQSIDRDDVYRCVIKNDDFRSLHDKLLYQDILVPVMLSVEDNRYTVTNYQNFLERTRYLRRGDYALSNTIIAPLTFEEIGHGENFSIRLITSFIRHHTIISNPLTGYLEKGRLINAEQLSNGFNLLLKLAGRMATARLSGLNRGEIVKYDPVGYILSADKDVEDERLQLRKKIINARFECLLKEAEQRLQAPDSAGDER